MNGMKFEVGKTYRSEPVPKFHFEGREKVYDGNDEIYEITIFSRKDETNRITFYGGKWNRKVKTDADGTEYIVSMNDYGQNVLFRADNVKEVA